MHMEEETKKFKSNKWQKTGIAFKVNDRRE